MAAQQWIERRKVGKGFHYTQGGQPIPDKDKRAYFASLRIPPAWQDVHIAVNKRAKILAIGTDKAGRKQYIYNPVFRAKQEQAKFDRILRFAKALPHMREVTERHLRHRTLDKEKVLACIVRLMDEAYFRVGNEVYAKEHHTYGLTTMRSKHTTVQGDTITFDFTGKSGQHHTKHITDRTLARVVKRLDNLPGYEVFKYYDDGGQLTSVDSSDVNAYIKELMGEEFSAKDFRTWGGTLIAAGELAAAERAASERERKKTVTTCVKKVARKLGNTPAVARSSYIDPRIIKAFVDSDDLVKMRRTMERIEQEEYVTPAERCVLQLLETA
ncbi:MAG TPA: hypothetical protein VD735_04550 [Candidatus Saccharimonadales bacterium]|nr:hypothetical protein [Candidatus Saccharimonadales bacterium]